MTGARTVEAVEEAIDLGGMGAGFASALDGELVSAVGTGENGGSEPDRLGRVILERLARLGVKGRPVIVPGKATDWTLIVSSGPFGDKLAVGFRGCHAAVERFPAEALADRCDLCVVAGWPNRLLDQALRHVEAPVKFLAPALRNMKDEEMPLDRLAGRFHILSCNRGEWASLRNPETVLRETPLVAITDGPDGATIHFHRSPSNPASLAIPVFPRDRPPRDTNRAGEAFASALVTTLLDRGWTPGPTDPALVQAAALRASASAALVLDREDFGFPTTEEIDEALKVGRVL